MFVNNYWPECLAKAVSTTKVMEITDEFLLGGYGELCGDASEFCLVSCDVKAQ